MFKNKKILAVIPARGGSKGVPGKNIRSAGGKPLIAWIIEAAKASQYVDRIILSSDNQKIIDSAKAFGCEVPFVRPSEFAQDNSSSSDVVVHALEKIPGYDYVMLFQPTSPLTLSRDIDGCIESCINSNAKAMVSVTEPGKNPYWMFKIGKDNKLLPLLGEDYLNKPRQQLPPVYTPTGAIYMAETGWFLKKQSFYSNVTKGFVMPLERSLDIDSELDFNFFETFLKRK